ncbi:MAG TPA: TlpA family protein disulfide reductase [Firmicutes bacterium]|nr:TlpA family protein disulfide reductase [Bacillota bacterium]
MLQLQHVYAQHGQEAAILAIGLDPEKEMIDDFLTVRQLTVPTLWDGRGKAAIRYQVRVIPTLVLLDVHGHIRYRHQGYLSAEEISRQLQPLIEEAGR